MALLEGIGKLKGSMMGIAVGGTFISCEINAEMYFEKELIPSSATGSGKFAESTPGKRRWRMSVDGNLLRRAMGADFKTLYRSWFNDELVQVEFRTRPFVDQYLIFRGNAWVQSGSALAPSTGLANWNIQLEGDGILNMDWEEFWAIINAMPPTANWPTIVEQDPNKWTT